MCVCVCAYACVYVCVCVLYYTGIRRTRHVSVVTVTVAKQPGLDSSGRDEHGARVVRFGGQAPVAFPHRLFRLRRTSVARVIPRYQAGQRVGEPILDGVHRPHGDQAGPSPGAGLFAGRSGPMLQAAVLHQVPGHRLGLVDNRSRWLLRQLLPR